MKQERSTRPRARAREEGGTRPIAVEGPKLAIDAHVHFHRRDWIEPTLDCAAENFRRAGTSTAGSGVLGALLLTQTTGERHFEWLREHGCIGQWRIDTTAEPQSLWLSRLDERLLVICGRQIRAERGLEMLALGTDARFAEDRGLERTLDEIRAADALPALPWGFGKWVGQRAELVRSMLARHGREGLWLGDNGGRLRALGRPRLLAEGEREGARVLPGTDPFPFGGDYRRVGSFGCFVRTMIIERWPWASIAGALARLERSPPAYGRGTGWVRFGVNQLWIQAHMRLHQKSP